MRIKVILAVLLSCSALSAENLEKTAVDVVQKPGVSM